MGKVLEEIGDKEAEFIAAQKIFFVATAPLSIEHHVSVSPKADGCVVLDPHTVAYADLTGSGAETAAHVLQNGRMTLMFCNIADGPPKILRLFGAAEVILAENVPPALKKKFPEKITSSFGFRCVYKLRVNRISTSCGYSLPIMTFRNNRNTLHEYTERLGKEGVFDYNTQKNSFSVDGLPSLALLRRKAPTVEPVANEGYIFGKVVIKGSSSAGDSSPKSIQFQPFTPRTKFALEGGYLILAALTIFAIGLATGLYGAQSSHF